MSFDKNIVENLYPEAGELMIEPMLIWKLPTGKEEKLSEVCSNGEYFLEEKIDGAFYQFVRTEHYEYLFGRTVSKTTGILTEKSANVPHIVEALASIPAGTVLIGEIYYPGKTSKNVTTIMGCLPEKAIKRQERDLIHYYIHDIIYYNGECLVDESAESRYDTLSFVWNEYNLSQYDFLRLAKQETENLEERISEILSSGGEGAVLKKRTAPYTPGKRPAWDTVKVKQMDCIDLVCTGFCEATRDYTGKLDLGPNYTGADSAEWPYWAVFKRDLKTGSEMCDSMVPIGDQYIIKGIDYITLPVTKPYYYNWNTAIKIGAYDKNGNLVELGTVSSGLTDEDREDTAKNPELYLNRVVALGCMSIDKKEHTLRHPVLRSWRDDKDAKDCIIEEIFK